MRTFVSTTAECERRANAVVEQVAESHAAAEGRGETVPAPEALQVDWPSIQQWLAAGGRFEALALTEAEDASAESGIEVPTRSADDLLPAIPALPWPPSRLGRSRCVKVGPQAKPNCSLPRRPDAPSASSNFSPRSRCRCFGAFE